MHVFDVARVQLAASTLGVGRAALEHAVDYAKSREAFGRRIHEFQAVSFRLADAKLKLDQARLLTLHAARLADEGSPFSTEAAMAKLAASEASVFAARRSRRRRSAAPATSATHRFRSGIAMRSSTRSGTARATSCA